MAFQLIGVVYSDTPGMKTTNNKACNVQGFKLIDTITYDTGYYDYNTVLNVIKSGKAEVIGIKYDATKGELSGSNGAFDRYPKFLNKVPVSNALVIMGSIDDIGYRVVNIDGKVADISVKDAKSALVTYGIANGKLLSRDGGTQDIIISSINGTYPVIPASQSSIVAKNNKVSLTDTQTLSKVEVVNKTDEEIKEEEKKHAKVYISTDKILRDRGIKSKLISGRRATPSRVKEVDKIYGLTADTKLANAVFAIKKTRPFFYSVLRCLKMVESASEDGIKTMGVTTDTLYYSVDFILESTIPELIFVLMHEACHIAMKHRARQEKRVHTIWNYATDLYINKRLSEDLELSVAGEPKEIPLLYSTDVGSDQKFRACLPKTLLFNDSINTQVDTAESLYDELYELILSDDGTGGSGDPVDVSGINQPNSGGGDGEQGTGNNNGKDLTQDNLKDKKFRGKELGNDSDDIMDDPASSKMNKEALEQRGTNIQKRIKTLHDNSFSNSGSGWLGEHVVKDIEKANKVNWKGVLRKRLNMVSAKETTFSKLDKRSSYLGKKLPGQALSDPDGIKNVKICFDISGSISEDELNTMYGQLRQLCREYKIEAELILWDTEIVSETAFDKFDTVIKNRKDVQGGGTDPQCIFKHFMTSPDYKKMRKKQPSAIIIFTDGGFGSIDEKYKIKYEKQTIWVILPRYKFEKPFGVIAEVSEDEFE